jgi:HD-GYP domain-containing protein (c-di-GMP phosphodiesterase class II)
MTTDRTYRKGQTKEAVLAEIKRCKGRQFDPDMTDCFMEMIGNGLRRE